MGIDHKKFQYVVSNLPKNIGTMKKVSFLPPVRILLAIINDENFLEILTQKEDIRTKFLDYFLDIWKPIVDEKKQIKDLKTRVEFRQNIIKIVEIILEILNDEEIKMKQNFEDIYSETNSIEEKLEEIFSVDQNKLEKKKEEISNIWKIRANPFLTPFVEDSWNQGKAFQYGAKLASSIETSWGQRTAEKIIIAYNSQIFHIGAGGMDFIRGEMAYDIKSGPNVMNKDQCEQVRIKNEKVRLLKNDNLLKNFISISDFKVAIMYGKKEIAGEFMKKIPSLIIYGSETWKQLTDDEFNSADYLLNSIDFKIKSGAIWTKEDIQEAYDLYIESFYDLSTDTKEILVVKEKLQEFMKNLNLQ